MKLILFALIMVTANAVAADKHYGNIVISEVVSVYDADTFRVNVPGWPDIIGKSAPIRVLGIDAPEIRGKCPSEKVAARAAKQFTIDMLANCKKIELRNIKRGKYFRILADVYIDDKSLSEALIQAGHARFYDGGFRSGWCAIQ